MNIPILDNFLNSITTYRLVLYSLTALSIIAIMFGFLGLLPYLGWQMILSVVFLQLTCLIVNTLCSYILKAPINIESQFITAFLLFFILSPLASVNDVIVLIVSGALAMVSKYIFAINKKHIFNPTALSIFLIGFIAPIYASWWVGSTAMQFFIAIAGILILKKLRMFYFFFTFLAVSLVIILGFSFATNTGGFLLLPQVFFSWPTVFFGIFMLTEPQTMPPTKELRYIYAVLIAVLSASQYQIGPIFSTPQFALIIGNIYSYFVSPKTKLFLHLSKKVNVSSDMYNFIFNVKNVPNFLPGQYMEWTLAHKKVDSRGNRRYFTIASSPTENDIILGVRINSKSSSFKTKLLQISKTDVIVAAQLAGDFILPKDESKKLVFLAGGIGITPFRSMVKYLIDTNKKRDIILLYSAKAVDEFAYREVFDKATKNGVKTMYTISEKNDAPKNWKGFGGKIDVTMIKKAAPDYLNRIFYLSGPQAMVISFEQILKGMGVRSSHIKKDFFPGF